MDTTELLQTAEALLAPFTERVERPEEGRMDVYLPADKIVAAAQALTDGRWGFLSAITGMDLPLAEGEEDGKIELLYHFCNMAAVVTLRVSVPHSSPALPSVCGVLPYATLYERELIEMLGVVLEGTPSTDRLFLPDDWPDGVYPLRKTFKGL